jgi:hypothetical protein
MWSDHCDWINRILAHQRIVNSSAFESVSQKDSRIDWRLTRRCTSHSYRGQPTSISHQLELIFRLKSQHLLLPTLKFLHKTQPHIYRSNLTCPVCKSESEDWFHVYACPSQRGSIQDCIELTMDFIIDRCKEYIIDMTSFSEELRNLMTWHIQMMLSQMNDNNRLH